VQPNKYANGKREPLSEVVAQIKNTHHPELFEIQIMFSGLAQELATSSNFFGMFGVPDGI
jgi:hypothetical protein